MTVTTVEALWANTPPVTSLTSGILDHASLEEDIAWRSPREIGLSYNCLETSVPTTVCGPTASKDFGNPGIIEGFQFAVYGGVSCKTIGFDEATGLSEIERVFALKESRAVARALMETRFVAGPDDDAGPGVDLRWPAATDITPAGGVSAKVGLAMLEGYASSVYSGQPTLHLPYTIGSLLGGDKVIESDGGKFYTPLGAKVAVDPGYEFPNSGPDGVEAAAGERWLYATGEVMVARSKVISNVATDYTNNDIYALAERRYIVAIDCFAAAIRVNVE